LQPKIFEKVLQCAQRCWLPLSNEFSHSLEVLWRCFSGP
jgi:hypothetical protein